MIPDEYNSDITDDIEPMNTPQFLSNDRYTARTEVISSGMVGDGFQCNVTSFASNTGSVTLRGKHSSCSVD